MDNENLSMNEKDTLDAAHKHDDVKTDSPYYGGEDGKKKKSPQSRSGAASIFDIAEMFAICAAVVLVIFFFVARLTVVDGPSMEPTLFKNDFILIRSVGYTPKRGDIVVVDDPTAGRYAHPLIKRVIAVGGDTLEIDFDTWTVKVNGNVVDESPYFDNSIVATLRAEYSLPKVIDEGKIFVMGDNRNHSADSRASDIGQIDERCVVGRAEMRVLKNFTVFKNPFDLKDN